MKKVTLSGLKIKHLMGLPVIITSHKQKMAVLVPYPQTAEDVEEMQRDLTALVEEKDE